MAPLSRTRRIRSTRHALLARPARTVSATRPTRALRRALTDALRCALPGAFTGAFTGAVLALGTGGVAATALAPRAAAAQQTIINVPSVDQTAPGRMFFLHESKVRAWQGENAWMTTHFLTYGVSRRFEVATTFYNFGTPLSPQSAVGVGWKTAQPLAEVFPAWAERTGAARWQPTLGAGQMIPVSTQGGGAGVWSYAQGAVRLPATGLRLMAGVSNGPPNLFGRRTTHFITSYEQPLHGLAHRIGGRVGHALEHVSVIGEWWSGRHEFADFVPGLNWHSGNNVVILGYKLGNAPGTRGDGIIFEIGRTF